jgi:hypothetical protein
MTRLQGPQQLVALVGVEHGLDEVSVADILNWSLELFDAHGPSRATAQPFSSYGLDHRRYSPETKPVGL